MPTANLTLSRKIKYGQSPLTFHVHPATQCDIPFIHAHKHCFLPPTTELPSLTPTTKLQPYTPLPATGTLRPGWRPIRRTKRNRFLPRATKAHPSEYIHAKVQSPAFADKHYSSAYLGETATIEVGTGLNKKTFHVHRDLLSFYSGYFKAALRGGFAEATSGVVQLETEEPVVFEGFVKWFTHTKLAQSGSTVKTTQNTLWPLSSYGSSPIAGMFHS